jgi:hypothetical protein
LPPACSCRACAFKRALGLQDLDWKSSSRSPALPHVLTAMAIRYAELTDDAVAIVISTGPVIDFCFFSDAIKSLPEITWLRKGTPVHDSPFPP